MLVIASLFVALMGFWLKSVELTFSAALVGIFQAISYRQDLVRIKRIVISALTRSAPTEYGKRQKQGRVDDLQSGVAREILQGITNFEQRIRELNWQSKEEISQDSFITAQSSSEISLGNEKYFAEIFNFIFKRFRCRAAAIVIEESSKLTFFSRGVGGARFESALEQWLEPYIKHGDSSFFRVCQEPDQGKLVGNFSIFGIGPSISYPLSMGSGKAVLWLGYSVGSSVSLAESRGIVTLAEKICMDQRSLQALEHLQKELQDALEQNRHKSEFIANMSHDIRAPLHNIRNIISYLRLEGPGEEVRGMLEAALDNCEQMGDIVEDVILFSRHQIGNLSAIRSNLDVTSSLLRIIENYRISADMKGLRVNLFESELRPKVYVDSKHFRRIIGNLLSNAIKYSSSGTIELGIQTSDASSLTIVVRDSGIGMTEQQVKGLFRPFTRFDKSGEDGIGLGLTIVKILTEANGGSIDVKSKYMSGTEFFVTFRKANDETVSESRPESQRELLDRSVVKILPGTDRRLVPSLTSANSQISGKQLPRGTGKASSGSFSLNDLTVLVVDDDRDSVDVVSRGLVQAGLNVLSAYNVNEALGILNFERPDLVITDAQMPDGGGRRVIGILSTLYPDVPSLVISGSDSEIDISELTQFGAAAVLRKPVMSDEIVKWILNFFQNGCKIAV